MKSFSTAVLAFASSALALNDWSTPCHAGQCSWYLPQTESRSSGVLHIWGSPMAIADITPAAGWSILGCSATSTAQDIRIACTNPNAECGHLLQADAVGRIVRLPDGCGTAPFARIAGMVVAEDQGLPRHLVRRGVAKPKVYALSLSNDFAGGSPHGPVNFAVHLTSSPRVDTAVITPPSRKRHQSRSIAEYQERQIKKRFIDDSVNSFLSARDVSFDGDHISINNVTQTFSPISLDKSGNIFNVSVNNCEIDGVPFDASVSADASATASATISLGFSATGQLLPIPTLDSAALTAGLNAKVEGSLHVKASADGTFSSPSITLFELPLPGNIGIPGVLDVGPVFKVVANANAKLAIGIDTVIGLSYAVSNASLVFPPDAGPSGGSFSAVGTPLSVSTDTNATGDATITAHVIPQLSVGITAFGNEVQATVTLALDGSATLDLNGTTGVQTSGGSKSVILPPEGCVDVSAGLDVSASADATLLQIFEKGTSVSLFSKEFDLFNSCATLGSGNDSSLSSNNDTSSSSNYNDTSSSDNSTSSSVNSTSSSSWSYGGSDEEYASASASAAAVYASASASAAAAYASASSAYYSSSSSSSGYGSSSGYSSSSDYSSSSGYGSGSGSGSSSGSDSSSNYDSSSSSSSSTSAYSSSSSYYKRTLIKRVDFTCPSLPFTIKAPPAPTKVTPSAKGDATAAKRRRMV